MSVIHYLKQELNICLPCGKTMNITGTDTSRHKNYFRLHQKKCDTCRPTKFDAIQTYCDAERQRQQGELRKMRSGDTNRHGTTNIAFDGETGKSLTESEVYEYEQKRLQEDKDAKWLTNMAMRCIKQNDDETNKINDFLCEKFGMNWKAEILADAVKSGNL